MIKMGLKKQFNIIILSMLLAVLAIFVIFILTIVKPINHKKNLYYEKTILNMADTINSTLNYNKKQSEVLIYNDRIQKFLIEKNPQKRSELSNIIYSFIPYIVTLNKDILLISLFDNDKNDTLFYSDNDVTNITVYNQLLKNYDLKDGFNFFYLEEPNTGNKTVYYSYKVTVYDVVSDQFQYKKEIGKLLMIFKTNSIFNCLYNFEGISFEEISLVDEDKIYLSKQNEMIGTKIDLNKYTNVYPIDDKNLKIVSKSLKNEYFESFTLTIIYFLIGILLLFVLMIIFINYWFKKNLLNYIDQIISAIQNINTTKNSRNKKINIIINNELGIIVDTINQMLENLYLINHKIFDTQQKLYEMEISSKQASIDMLQSQINPHFLYNTLGCIRSIALKHKIFNIATMVDAIVLLFRYSLKGDEYVTIENELESIKRYMEIIDIRYEGKITFVFDFEEELYNKKIIRFLFEPLVENAIQHGLELSLNKGILKISGSVKKDKIIIKIEDNGVGIEEQSLDSINKLIINGVVNSNTHMGLINVNKRIKLVYGEEYGIHLNSIYGKGSIVTIELPNQNF